MHTKFTSCSVRVSPILFCGRTAFLLNTSSVTLNLNNNMNSTRHNIYIWRLEGSVQLFLHQILKKGEVRFLCAWFQSFIHNRYKKGDAKKLNRHARIFTKTRFRGLLKTGSSELAMELFFWLFYKSDVLLRAWQILR